MSEYTESLDTIEKLTDRIEELEDFEGRLPTLIKSFQMILDINIKRVDELERWQKVAIEKNIEDIQRIRKLEKNISQLLSSHKMVYKTPHKCPVCEGSGNKLYLIAQETHECHACEGKGVLWG